jgi:hypothetical protein
MLSCVGFNLWDWTWFFFGIAWDVSLSWVSGSTEMSCACVYIYTLYLSISELYTPCTLPSQWDHVLQPLVPTTKDSSPPSSFQRIYMYRQLQIHPGFLSSPVLSSSKFAKHIITCTPHRPVGSMPFFKKPPPKGIERDMVTAQMVEMLEFPKAFSPSPCLPLRMVRYLKVHASLLSLSLSRPLFPRAF